MSSGRSANWKGHSRPVARVSALYASKIKHVIAPQSVSWEARPNDFAFSLPTRRLRISACANDVPADRPWIRTHRRASIAVPLVRKCHYPVQARTGAA